MEISSFLLFGSLNHNNIECVGNEREKKRDAGIEDSNDGERAACAEINNDYTPDCKFLFTNRAGCIFANIDLWF